MKETKVYVDELPKSCTDCPCYDFDIGGCQCKDPHFTYDSINRFKGCLLIDIKVHDREVVKEVCEKIKLKFSDTRSHNWGIEQFELYEFLDQIQIEVVEE